MHEGIRESQSISGLKSRFVSKRDIFRIVVIDALNTVDPHKVKVRIGRSGLESIHRVGNALFQVAQSTKECFKGNTSILQHINFIGSAMEFETTSHYPYPATARWIDAVRTGFDLCQATGGRRCKTFGGQPHLLLIGEQPGTVRGDLSLTAKAPLT